MKLTAPHPSLTWAAPLGAFGLLIVLGALQYRWIGQLGGAERRTGRRAPANGAGAAVVFQEF